MLEILKLNGSERCAHTARVISELKGSSRSFDPAEVE